MWPASVNMEFPPKDEVKSELFPCRGCLGDGQMFNMHQYRLAEPYKQLVGVEVKVPSLLPQHLCHICRAFLIKFSVFRERCRRTEVLLQSLAMINPVVTTEDMSSIDRFTQRLAPVYIQTKPYIVSITDFMESNEEKLESNTEQNSNLSFDDYKNDLVPAVEEDDQKADIDFYQTDGFDPEDIKLSDLKREKTLKKSKRLMKKNKREVDVKVGERKRKVKREVKEECSVEIEIDTAEVEEKAIVRRKTKPRVNNLYSDPEDREKFSQKYDVDIIVMTKEDEMNDMLERKNSPKYLRAHNKCEECYKGFIHEDTLKRHIKDKHDPSLEHVCEFCRFRFSKRVNLTGHYRRHHKYKYICRVCTIVTRMREHAVQHSKMHTQKFECKYCGKTFNTKGTTYHAHVRNKHSSELPWCRICGDAFVCTKTHMERLHKQALEPVPELQCPRCNVQFLNAAAVFAHGRGGCGARAACLHCGLGFEAEPELREHVLALHKIQYPCDKCNKVFSHESKLNNHTLEKHCDPDPGPEGQRSARKRYMKVVPAMCDICGKIIADQYHMVYHQRIHTGEKPYACADCPKRFRMPEQLQNHVRIHTGERPFKCKYCTSTFKTYPALSRHRLVHTGERRYPCPVCRKHFATTAEMKTHLATVHMKIPKPPRNRRRNKQALP